MKYKFIIAFLSNESFSHPKLYVRVSEDWHSEVMDALFDNDYKTNICSVATWVVEKGKPENNCHEINNEGDLIEFQIFLDSKNHK
jgi:hypothetical protein